MAGRQAWLTVLARVTDSRRATGAGPCPNCDKDQLEIRYIVDQETRLGYLRFWCHACLHGIAVSRACAPEGMSTRAIGDPDAIADVPDFTRDD
jgi:hypothetical protein